LLNIPSGEKKDLRFIKYLAMVFFGPEVLAASTIYGTAKGGRKKSDESNKTKSPALDKTILRTVLGK